MSQNNWWCNKCQGLWFAGNPTSVCPAGDAHTQAGSGVYELLNSGSGQSNWRWCNLCQGLFFVGNNTLGVCPAHSHSDAGSGDYVLSTSGSSQSNWRWCSKCQGLWFAGNNTLGVCAAGGTHREAASGDYVLSTSGSGQSNWRWCNKCQGLWFAGNNTSVCPAGGTHTEAGSGDYVLSTSGSGQSNWRWCNKCQGLFFAGNNTLGVCPSHSHSDAGSGDYVLSTSGSGQSNWRWCSKCQGLWFAGNNTSVCPAGGAHTEASSGDYVLAAGLGSSNNAILVNNCQNLENLQVSLVVTEGLVTAGNTGFSLQLNCYPQIGSKSPNATPQTGDSSLTWFQYVIYVSNNQLGWQIQYWANLAHSYQEGPPKIVWPPGYTPNPPNTTPWLPVLPNDDQIQSFGPAPSNQIPAGSVMAINLETDAGGNVTLAAFKVTYPSDPGNPNSFNATFTFPSGATYPIYGFQVDIVGPGNFSSCTFTSGAGSLSYFVSSGALAVQDSSTACGGLQPGTGESSNIAYGDVIPASGPVVNQTFQR